MGNQFFNKKHNEPNKTEEPNKIPSVNERRFTNTIKSSDLLMTFKTYAIEGQYLNLEQFNNSISNLLKFDLPIICHTYLTERLFNLLDKDQTKRISQDTFIEGMKTVLSGIESQIKITFDAIVSNRNKTYIDLPEIVDYFLKSWQSAFKFVYFYLNSNCVNEFNLLGVELPPNVDQFENVVYSYEENVRKYILGTFNEIGLDATKGISYEFFTAWVLKDLTLEVTYHNKTFRFATTLTCLYDVGIVDEQK